MSKIFIKPKIMSIKARLRNTSYANFLEFYHEQSAITDHFYKYLIDLSNKHKLLVQADTNFKSNFTSEGFYFKVADRLKCKNALGKPCLIEDLIDRDVTMKLKITPYNFLSDENKQLIGISMQAIEITGHYETR